MIINLQIKNKLKARFLRIIAEYLAIIIFCEALYPISAWALTGGPSQPEVQSFEPVGTSEMVDLFTGDFNYNIPLLDVGGYPVNISYHSGIGMDQEASWVGLGWNINPGVINRSMRGIPDDFNGDLITKEFNIKPNKTYGATVGVGGELAGFDEQTEFGVKAGVSYSVGVRYNNYTGIGVEQSVNLSLNAGVSGKAGGNANLGITSSSDEGLTLQPSVGLSVAIPKTGAAEVNLGLSVGSAFNSRAGLKSLTISNSASVQSTQQSLKRAYAASGEKPGGTYFGAGVSTNASFNLGMPTYTPQINLPMRNYSITGKFKLGSESWTIHPYASVSGYYSSQQLAQTLISSPAYGYMNADEGIGLENAVLDFNREKDIPFTKSTVALPITNFTYDIYSVSGQGIGGSYRPFRSDMGYVFDPANSTKSDGKSIGLELGIGDYAHGGTDISITNVDSKSGIWSYNNDAASSLTFRGSSEQSLYEKYYFKEANEKLVDSDTDFFNAIGGFDAQCFNLLKISDFNIKAESKFVNDKGNITPITAVNYRKKREKRNQLITTLTRGELADAGLEVFPNLYNDAQNHHIAEVTTVATDGSRYVYGIAAYNTRQEETTFSVGADMNDNGGYSGNCAAGLVSYNLNDNSKSNKLGLDNYFSNTILPPYAHSYLLTAVLTSDYIDADAIRGPSDGDLGNYTKFYYHKINDYKWRVPVQENIATFNETLKSDKQDDKANYIYGEKELWYMDSIATKNYIAIFKTEPRKDGSGVLGKNGGVDTDVNKAMRLLRKISLYSRPDYKSNGTNATPIKEVHFEYDYSLCPKIPNNIEVNSGKLTLKKIYFTYQDSKKARLSPYQFIYSNFNPPYNIKGYDRWGNYKPNDNAVCDPTGDPSNIPTAEYPYVEQDKTIADIYASAWNLKEIDLPSGGIIKIQYESDDYAYVQDKPAMQMFRVIGTSTSDYGNTSANLKDISNQSTLLYFKGAPGTLAGNYFSGINNMYFRFLMEITPSSTGKQRFEYVSGYASIQSSGFDPVTGYGWVMLKPTPLKNTHASSNLVNPITKAAIQFLRLNRPKWAWGEEIKGEPAMGKKLLTAMLNSGFTKNISDAIKGPNKSIFDQGKCRQAVMNKSWIRLNNPGKNKLGGGLRVTKITISDEWHEMTNNNEESYDYGQQYSYTLHDGTSSGVASYEPQLGGDENPWKQPVFFNEEKLLIPDDEHYMEEPFGESFFPSPMVGYSLVTVENLKRQNVTRHATGKIVHEFYTAKDFPTITKKTKLVPLEDKDDPMSIRSLFKISVRDFMTATQGYVIELNDMQGKTKSREIFQEGNHVPISSIKYKYKSPAGSNHLDNSVTVVQKDGTVNDAAIGVIYDFVSDMREQSSKINSTTASPNLDLMEILGVPIPVPTVWPSFAKEKTQFRSAVITKVIQRFGILDEIIVNDDGSVVSTKNLAYDSETGSVLLTQTTTNFNDSIYSLTYPAHWYYDGMGQAYQNIGYKTILVFNNDGVALVNNALSYFAEGDELALPDGTIGWVTEVTESFVRAVKKDGLPVNINGLIKIIRSGRRNMQSVPIANLTLSANPLNKITSNVFGNELQASAIEYGNVWRTYCDCFEKTDANNFTSNPYILGTKGNWKPKRSYKYLTGRSQTNYDGNTNIRHDGIFTAFNPFYTISNGKWVMDERNWTFTSEVTEFSPLGPGLENKDALGRFSSASFGYNQIFETAVVANARHNEIGFDNFEDYDFAKCADSHFKFNEQLITIDKTQSHTGSKSIKVSTNSPVYLEKQLAPCQQSQACNVTLTQVDAQTQTNLYINGGTGPYIVDWDIINGDPNLVLNNAQPGVQINNLGWTIEFVVTDAKGCKIIQSITR